VDMQTSVLDGQGTDVTVYEGDGTPEGYAVYALESIDGYWNYIGSGIGTSSFDIATAGIPSAQFFVLLDDNNGTANVNDAGFDFDAIENLHPAIPDTLAHLSGKVFDALSGLPLIGAIITFSDTTLVSDTAGYYSVDLVRGTYVTCAAILDHNMRCDTIELAPGLQSTHDFYLDYNVGLAKIAEKEAFTARPNPFSDELEIRFRNENAGRVQVKLTQLTGESIVISDESYPVGECTVNFRPADKGLNLTSGMYLLSIETASGMQFRKVIKISK
jgi:hypothetical protein